MSSGDAAQNPLPSSLRLPTQTQGVLEKGQKECVSEKQEHGGESSSTATSSSSSIPTGPANGFWWDPAIDSLNLSPSTDADADRSSNSLDASDDSFCVLPPFILGSVVGCIGATIYQVFVFKPIYATVSSPFLILLVHMLSLACERIVPSAQKRFGLKEHALASMIAIAASRGNLAVQTFAVQRLYYEQSRVGLSSAALGIFATAGLGCGIAGLFASFAALHPDIVFPLNLPSISLLKELNSRPPVLRLYRERLPLFAYVFGGSFLYEVIPAYIAPILTGVSVFCLSTQKAASEVRRTITNVFGGASGNEGLGLLSLCFDWQFIGTSSAAMPLVYQGNTWVGYLLCYGAVMGLYYSNVTSNALMIATAIFGEDGEVYDQTLVLDERFEVDRNMLEKVGLPKLATSALWTSVTANIAFGSLVAYAALHLGWKAFWPFATSQDKRPQESGPSDATAHSKVSKTPGWWHVLLIFLALLAGITLVLRQRVHGSHTAFFSAVVFGVLAVPISTSLYGHLGTDMVFRHVSKMIGATLLPDRPLAILYFSMWSNSVVSISIFAISQIHFGHSLEIPPKLVFLLTLWGLVMGALVNYAVSESIIQHQAPTLVAATGLYMWSGQLMQTMNSEAVTWALARDLYSIGGPYYMIPFGLLIGLILSAAQYSLGKLFPKTSLFNGRVVMIPVIFTASSMMTYGNTSAVLSTVVVGAVSQFWLAKRTNKEVYETSATVVGAALDGGAQTMLLVLSFSVLGAIGIYIPFFKWIGNNVDGNVDYCDLSSY